MLFCVAAYIHQAIKSLNDAHNRLPSALTCADQAKLNLPLSFRTDEADQVHGGADHRGVPRE